MKSLASFLLGVLTVYLLDYILVIYAEQELDYLYEVTAEGALRCPATYEWN